MQFDRYKKNTESEEPCSGSIKKGKSPLFRCFCYSDPTVLYLSSIGKKDGRGHRGLFLLKNVLQLRANDCQNCGLWVK